MLEPLERHMALLNFSKTKAQTAPLSQQKRGTPRLRTINQMKKSPSWATFINF